MLRILLLILAARAAVPLAPRLPGSSAAPWDTCAVRRCAWPKPSARQVFAKLVAMVREVGACPSPVAEQHLAEPAFVALATTSWSGSLERYAQRALGCPRC